MNILVISPWSDDWDLKRVIGGPKIGVLIKGLTEMGVKIHLVIPEKKEFTSSNINNLFIHLIHTFWFPQFKLLLPIMRVISYLISNIYFIFYGLKLSKQYSFDLIYGLSSFLGLAVYYLGRKLSKPTILKLLGIITLYPIKKCNPLHWLIYFDEVIAYKLLFDKLIVVDDGTYGDKVAEYFNVPKNRFLFQPHIIDKRLANSPYPENLKEELGFGQDNYIVLFAARLTPLKGLDIALRAMKLVLEREPGVRLLVVGDGPTREGDEKLAKELGIWECVKFVGSARYIEMWKYYRIADVFLSTNTISNLCLPTVEAMASGVPVVTLDIRDTRKAIKNGVTGFLVDFGVGASRRLAPTYKGIADAICLLLKDEYLRERIGDKAKEFVLSHFPDWNDGVLGELRLIKSLIKGKLR